MRPIATDVCRKSVVFLFLVFPYFYVSVPCARLSWPSRQLLSARKYTVSYRGVAWSVCLCVGHTSDMLCKNG